MEITKIERIKELNYFIKRKNKLLVKLIKRERGSTNFNSVKDEKGDIAEDSGISENHKDIRYEAAFHQSKKKKRWISWYIGPTIVTSRWNQQLKRLITINKIEALKNNVPINKTPR